MLMLGAPTSERRQRPAAGNLEVGARRPAAARARVWKTHAVPASSDECFICKKHAEGESAQGGTLLDSDLVYVGHTHALDGPTAYRGYFMVEPKRHVHQLGDLTDDEAAAIGMAVNEVARLQRSELGAEHVYSFVYGDGVAHLHIHLAPRYPKTPREYWGPLLTTWPDAPRITEPEMRQLVADLREILQ